MTIVLSRCCETQENDNKEGGELANSRGKAVKVGVIS